MSLLLLFLLLKKKRKLQLNIYLYTDDVVHTIAFSFSQVFLSFSFFFFLIKKNYTFSTKKTWQNSNKMRTLFMLLWITIICSKFYFFYFLRRKIILQMLWNHRNLVTNCSEMVNSNSEWPEKRLRISGALSIFYQLNPQTSNMSPVRVKLSGRWQDLPKLLPKSVINIIFLLCLTPLALYFYISHIKNYKNTKFLQKN